MKRLPLLLLIGILFLGVSASADTLDGDSDNWLMWNDDADAYPYLNLFNPDRSLGSSSTNYPGGYFSVNGSDVNSVIYTYLYIPASQQALHAASDYRLTCYYRIAEKGTASNGAWVTLSNYQQSNGGYDDLWLDTTLAGQYASYHMYFLKWGFDISGIQCDPDDIIEFHLEPTLSGSVTSDTMLMYLNVVDKSSGSGLADISSIVSAITNTDSHVQQLVTSSANIYSILSGSVLSNIASLNSKLSSMTDSLNAIQASVTGIGSSSAQFFYYGDNFLMLPYSNTVTYNFTSGRDDFYFYRFVPDTAYYGYVSIAMPYTSSAMDVRLGGETYYYTGTGMLGSTRCRFYCFRFDVPAQKTGEPFYVRKKLTMPSWTNPYRLIYANCVPLAERNIYLNVESMLESILSLEGDVSTYLPTITNYLHDLVSLSQEQLAAQESIAAAYSGVKQEASDLNAAITPARPSDAAGDVSGVISNVDLTGFAGPSMILASILSNNFILKILLMSIACGVIAYVFHGKE